MYYPTAVDLHRKSARKRECDLLDDQECIVHRNRKSLVRDPLKNRAQRLRGNVIAGNGGGFVVGDAVDTGGDIGGLESGRYAPGPVERSGHIACRHLSSVEDSQPNGASDPSSIKFARPIETAKRIDKNLLEQKI